MHRITVEWNLVECRAIRLHVVVGVVESWCHKMAAEIDRSASIESRQLAALSDGNNPIANDPNRSRTSQRWINGENIRVVENEVEAHAPTLDRCSEFRRSQPPLMPEPNNPPGTF